MKGAARSTAAAASSDPCVKLRSAALACIEQHLHLKGHNGSEMKRLLQLLSRLTGFGPDFCLVFNRLKLGTWRRSLTRLRQEHFGKWETDKGIILGFFFVPLVS